VESTYRWFCESNASAMAVSYFPAQNKGLNPTPTEA